MCTHVRLAFPGSLLGLADIPWRLAWLVELEPACSSGSSTTYAGTGQPVVGFLPNTFAMPVMTRQCLCLNRQTSLGRPQAVHPPAQLHVCAQVCCNAVVWRARNCCLACAACQLPLPLPCTWRTMPQVCGVSSTRGGCISNSRCCFVVCASIGTAWSRFEGLPFWARQEVPPTAAATAS